MRLPRREMARFFREKIATAIQDSTIPIAMMQGTPPPGKFIVYDMDYTPGPSIGSVSRCDIFVTVNVYGQNYDDVLELMNTVEKIFDDGVNIRSTVAGVSEPTKNWNVDRFYQRGESRTQNLFVAGVERPIGVIVFSTQIHER